MRKVVKVIFVLIGLGWCTACEPTGQVKPNDLLAQEPMILVLKDICLVEARFQRRLSVPGINHGDLVFENYKIIFEGHNISMEQFKNSYAYYEESPELMQQMYDSVIVVLSKEESELKSKGDPNYPKMAH